MKFRKWDAEKAEKESYKQRKPFATPVAAFLMQELCLGKFGMPNPGIPAGRGSFATSTLGGTPTETGSPAEKSN